MFATYAFSATSSCCLGMETCRCVELTGVGLPVAQILPRQVAPVEKTDNALEMAMMGRRRHGEGGRRAAVLGRGGDVIWRLVERS
jgi:hypothetical protein